MPDTEENEVRELKSKDRIIVTTLLDAKCYKKKRIIKLYSKRWLVEIDLFFIKKIMDMDILRTKTPGMVIKEFYIGLIAYNILRSIIAQSAWKQGVLPRSLSLKGALQAFQSLRPN